MFALFILPIAITSMSSAVVSLTGGMGWVMAAASNTLFHRTRGYKPNEGHFTDRCQNQYFGVWFDSSSTYDINRALGQLSDALPGVFPDTKKFDLTISEGEFLRDMLAPALEALTDFQAVKVLVLETNGSEESFRLLDAEADRLAIAAIPIARWLEQFPRAKNL